MKKTILYSSISTLIKVIFPFLINMSLGRVWGSDILGEYAYILAIQSIFLSLSIFGLDAVTIRNITRKYKFSLVYSFKIRISISIVLSLIYYYLMIDILGDSSDDLILYSAIAIAISSLTTIEYHYYAKSNLKILMIASIASYGFFGVIKVLVLIEYGNIYYKFLIDCLEIIAYSLVLFFHFGIKNAMAIFRGVLSKGKRNYWKIMFLESLPLAINSLLVIAYLKVDQIMIKEFLSFDMLGIYSVAAIICSSLSIIPSVVMNVLFPKLVVYVDEGNEKKIINIYHLMAVLFCVIFALLNASSVYLVPFIYGDEYHLAQDIISVYSIGFAFVYFGAISGSIIIIKGLQKYSIYRSLLSFIVNIALNLILISRMGLIGAAIASVIAQFVSNYLFYFLIHKIRNEFYIMNKAILTFPRYIAGKFSEYTQH